jgi:hypothetical protein
MDLRSALGAWQREMAPYFTELGGRLPDQGFKRVDEIFHLD